MSKLRFHTVLRDQKVIVEAEMEVMPDTIKATIAVFDRKGEMLALNLTRQEMAQLCREAAKHEKGKKLQ